MAGERWIANLSATTPVASAARHVLSVRLGAVRDCLPLALQPADSKSEHIHQLRVSTRRARAALDIFSCCLPERTYSGAKKRLRRLRRVAGEARDWDIFLGALIDVTKRLGSKLHRCRDLLTGYALAQRSASQVRLEEACHDFPFAFDRFLAETVAAVRKPREPHPTVLRDLAQPVLTSLLEELETGYGGDLEDVSHLHSIRVVGKRLRYGMEIFPACFTASFRKNLYPMLVEMQEILGLVNDSHVTCIRLGTLRAKLSATLPKEWKRYQSGFETLVSYHQELIPVHKKRFHEWLMSWSKTGGEQILLSLVGQSRKIAS
jgi:CHAD domain-containing protein